MATKQFVSSFARLVLQPFVVVLLLGAPSHRAEAQCATLTACVDSKDVVDFSIQTIDIAINAIGAQQIGPLAVGTSELQDLSVGPRQLRHRAVGQEQSSSIAFAAARTKTAIL